MADLDKQTVFNDELAAAAPLRLSSTDIQGQSQVIAVSEDSINAILSARFNSLLKRNKDKRLREFNHAVPGYGSITATLTAPHLRMIVPETPQSVLFYLNFGSGSFEFYSGFGPNAVLKTQDISGWSVAFKTSFGLSAMAQIPAAIADQITLLKPESYSVSQLLVGLSAAAASVVDWDQSICPGLDTDPDLRFASTNMFKQYMDVYLDWMSNGPYSVLGYAIQVTDPEANANLPVPSFPPTAVQCRTQQYVPQTDAFKEVFPGNAGLDVFLFQEMTQYLDFPVVPYNASTAGNWVVGGIPASLTMSKDIFWEGYIMEQFSALNMQCLDLINNAYYWVQNRKDPVWTGNPWVLTWEGPPASTPWTATENGATFSWHGEHWDDERSWSGAWRDNVTTDVYNTMSWNQGTNTVNVTVDIKQNRDKWTQGHGGGTDTLSGGDTHITWGVTLSLDSIKEGTLSLTVTPGVPTLEYKFQSSNDFWDFGGHLKASYENAATEALKTGTDFPAMAENLQNALNQQSKFVFPGGGDFFMTNPAFNTNGDLLIQLSYMDAGISIDDTFQLQVSAPGTEGLDGYWLQVQTEDDKSAVVLVQNKADATVFELDNGNLVVDQGDLPVGNRGISFPIPDGEDANVVGLLFDTPATFEEQDKENQLQCSITGNDFAFYSETIKDWANHFVVDAEDQIKVHLFTGNANDPLYKSSFTLTAIY